MSRHRPVFRCALPLVLVCLTALLQGCVVSQEMLQGLAAEMQRQSLVPASAQPSGEKPLLTLEPTGESAALDSLFRLIAQDVGINPEEGNVQRLIWRVRVIRLNTETARQAINNCRSEIFNIAANTEQIRALKELNGRISLAEGEQKDELIAERRRYEDETIQGAKSDGSLEQKRLGGDQAARVGLLLYNLGVAGICDNLALRHIPNIDNDFKQVKADLFERGGVDALWAGVSLGLYSKEFLAIPSDLLTLGGELPRQLGAIGHLVGTIGVLKKNNRITEREAKPGDRFEDTEQF